MWQFYFYFIRGKEGKKSFGQTENYFLSIRTTSHTCFFSVCLTNVHYSRLDFLFYTSFSCQCLYYFLISFLYFLKSLGLVLLHSFKYFLLSTTISDSVFKTCLLQLGIHFFFFFHYKYNISICSSTSFFSLKFHHLQIQTVSVWVFVYVCVLFQVCVVLLEKYRLIEKQFNGKVVLVGYFKNALLRIVCGNFQV